MSCFCTDGTTVENKGKLILIKFQYYFLWDNRVAYYMYFCSP